jgi:hypothetical protein
MITQEYRSGAKTLINREQTIAWLLDTKTMQVLAETEAVMSSVLDKALKGRL